MKKSQINPMPKFFDRYIHLVKEEDLLTALEQSLEDFVDFDFDLLEELGDRTYEENKWTVKEILQHVIDNERIQSYRALRFARRDDTVLPGYDEQHLARYSYANNRSLEKIKDEFALVRRASIALFKSLDAEALLNKGVCYQVEISPLALGFVLVGHQIHHLRILQERYLPLLVHSV
ncbi:MAG TPA: DinB family protein [Cytophagales bacterium]|nr:DinB family protein [Cytophagales bacterium]